MSAAPRLPSLPIPAPLRATDGGFTETSVLKRLPDILERLLMENKYPEDVAAQIRAIEAEITSKAGCISDIPDDGGPDVADWAIRTRPYIGMSWVEAPWYFVESYMYRRILAAIAYWQPSSPFYKRDPFEPHKLKALSHDMPAIRTLSEQVNEWSSSKSVTEAGFMGVLEAALWGNRADLSVKPKGGDAPSRALDAHSDLLLVNDAPEVWQHVKHLRGARVDFIIDNAGFELACDLCFADYLFASGIASNIVFHLKGYPLFVSDALAKDVRGTVEALAQSSEPATCNAIASRLTERLTSGAWELREDLFWTGPEPFWEMPQRLRDDLSGAAVVFIKGDANYRRIGGDRHWPYETPLKSVARYFPAPFVTLRTNKSGTIIAGPEAIPAIARAADVDPDWLTSGKYGVIQFLKP